MSITDSLSLFVAMLVLASLPSASVLLICANASSDGFAQGAYTALGVLLGDLLFVLLALLGLTLLANTLGTAFVLIHLCGACYLLWLGFHLWRKSRAQLAPTTTQSLAASCLTGLAITLGDSKAILFYLGFLPVFVDLSRLDASDASLILAITVLAVGGVKLAYAWLATRVSLNFGAKLGNRLQKITAALISGTAIWLLLRSYLLLFDSSGFSVFLE